MFEELATKSHLLILKKVKLLPLDLQANDKGARNVEENDAAYVRARSELVEVMSKLASLQNQVKRSNIFSQLNAYKSPPLATFNSFPGNVPLYSSVYIGLKHNPNYCDIVDTYNLYNPENVFDNMNFVGDYNPNSNISTTNLPF